MRAWCLVLLLASSGCQCGPLVTSGDGGAEPDAARPDSGAPRPDAGPTDAGLVPTAECVAPTVNTQATGQAPIELGVLAYSFLGFTAGSGHDCYDFRMFVSATAALSPEYLELFASRATVVPGQPLDVTALFHQRDGGLLTTQAVVTMDTYDAQASTGQGRFGLTQNGWSLQGTFDAGHCALADDTCI
jgi:hypothetical protein